jgi:cell division septation protein DedD
VGKSSAKEQALNDQAASAAADAGSIPDSRKPSAVVAVKAQPSAGDGQPPETKPSDLTFYKSVQQDQPNTKLTTPQDPLPATTTKGPASTPPSPSADETAKAVAPTTSRTTSGADHGAYMVQIAAVSKQEDAAALAGALKKKSYDVFVVNSPTGADNLFHVQVGPFASLQDAEAMKTKLIGDGYNAFVKR